MKVTILGTGNVATVLGKKILEKGYSIQQVYGRDRQKAEALAAQLQSNAVDQLQQIEAADLYILAVSDSSIISIAENVRISQGIIVHTAAAVSIDALKHMSDHYGVIYPLQSLRSTAAHIPEIPVFVDGNTNEVKDELMHFCRNVFDAVHATNDEQRVQLHIAAVFVSNFVNHLYALADQYTEYEGLPFEVLRPLMLETVQRLQNERPFDMQTGPAVRADLPTIDAHMQRLNEHPHLQKIYELLTESIIQLHRRPL